MSKFVFLSSSKNKTEKVFRFLKLLNVVHIYEEFRKVFVKSYERSLKLTTTQVYNESQIENLSNLLFPDRTKNLNRMKLFANFFSHHNVIIAENKVHSAWAYFLEAAAKNLNANIEYIQLPFDKNTTTDIQIKLVYQQFIKGELDFFLNHFFGHGDLQSYNINEYCFVAPLPPKYSIVELVLILPLDKSCWMWLGISLFVSSIIWILFEGAGSSLKFMFGMFAFFVGQSADIKW